MSLVRLCWEGYPYCCGGYPGDHKDVEADYTGVRKDVGADYPGVRKDVGEHRGTELLWPDVAETLLIPVKLGENCR